MYLNVVEAINSENIIQHHFDNLCKLKLFYADLNNFSGSGKKALLDVIARRVQGPTRGQILLNNQPLSLTVFNQRCGYVTHKCDLIPGLTVEENLYYTPTKVRA